LAVPGGFPVDRNDDIIVGDARVNEAAFVLLEQTFVEQNLELHAELTVPFR
jgi:hypothetical protein